MLFSENIKMLLLTELKSVSPSGYEIYYKVLNEENL